MKRMNLVFCGVVSLILLAGCASTGPVEKVSPRLVDRAYTLPDGVATWSTFAVLGNIKTPSDNVFIPPIPFPLFWQQAINNDLTLVWGPLPLGLLYQISKTDTQLWGASFNVGLGYGSVTGWTIQPGASVTNRSKVKSNLAIQTSVSGGVGIVTNRTSSTGYSASVVSGPIFQISDTFAVDAGAGLQFSKANLGFANLSNETTNATSTLVPLSVGTDWRFAKQWSFNTSYTYYGLGNSDWSGNFLLFDLTHYW